MTRKGPRSAQRVREQANTLRETILWRQRQHAIYEDETVLLKAVEAFITLYDVVA